MLANIQIINPIFEGKYNLKTAEKLKTSVTKPICDGEDTFISRTRKTIKNSFLKQFLQKKYADKLSKVLRRNISQQELKKIIQEYRELLNITDRDEFIQKAFEQIKKDYGYANKDIKLIIQDETKNNEARWNVGLGCVVMNASAINKLWPNNILKRKEQLHIIDTLIHEFQHTKQYEYAYRANPERYLKLFDGYEEALNNQLKLYGDLERFPKDSENYKLGTKYIENIENYISGNWFYHDEYKSQMIEKEAFGAGKIITMLLKDEILTPIERFKLNFQDVKKNISILPDKLYVKIITKLMKSDSKFVGYKEASL